MADTDLAELRKKCVTSLFLCIDNVSRYLDKEKDKEFAKLRSVVQDCCLLEAQHDVAIQALKTAKRETNASNFDTLEERFLAIRNKPQRNISNHPYLLEFDKKIKRGCESNLDDSDIAITQTQESHIDALTRRVIKNPVRNTLCGHVYERNSILHHLRRENAKCPVVGCANRVPILEEHLIEDEELRFRLDIDHHSTLIPNRSVQDLDVTMN